MTSFSRRAAALIGARARPSSSSSRSTSSPTARSRTTRIDLTDQHLYTLSQGTRDTLAKIDEPIVLRFYYSPRLGDEIPSYGVYAQRVREMLEEYAAAANGKIELQILDPEPFSPIEDRAVAFGLQGVPLDQGGEQVYFGLAATNSTDDQQVIPFFQPERERFLEYDMTKLHPQPRLPQEAGGRARHRAAARRRHHGGDAGPADGALRRHRAAPASSTTCTRSRPSSTRCRTTSTC